MVHQRQRQSRPNPVEAVEAAWPSFVARQLALKLATKTALVSLAPVFARCSVLNKMSQRPSIELARQPARSLARSLGCLLQKSLGCSRKKASSRRNPVGQIGATGSLGRLWQVSRGGSGSLTRLTATKALHCAGRVARQVARPSCVGRVAPPRSRRLNRRHRPRSLDRPAWLAGAASLSRELTSSTLSARVASM